MYRIPVSCERSAEFFRSLVVSNDDTGGYVPCSPTAELLNRFTPRDSFICRRGEDVRFNSGEWRVVYCCTKNVGVSDDDPKIIVKVALQHRSTGAVRLQTTCNFVPTERHKMSVADDWFVLTADMVAPGMFWTALKHAL